MKFDSFATWDWVILACFQGLKVFRKIHYSSLKNIFNFFKTVDNYNYRLYIVV